MSFNHPHRSARFFRRSPPIAATTPKVAPHKNRDIPYIIQPAPPTSPESARP